MKIRTDPMCPKCGEERETAYHFLGKCNAMMMVRYSIFGAYLMEPGELQKVQLHTALRFARASESLKYNLPVISGLHIGPNLTMASALDGFDGRPPRR